jgi:hypothetical protein
MGPKKDAKSERDFGGSPAELPDIYLPTHRDIARYFYHVRLTEKDYCTQVHSVKDRIIRVWQDCKPRLPLLGKKRVYDKLKHFLDKVKSFDMKQMKLAAKKILLLQKEKFFDIAACRCSLPVHSCNSKFVRCVKEICLEHHILCECPIDQR